MPVVELLFWPGCPHVEGARKQLRRALAEVSLPIRWSEHDVTSEIAPVHTRGYGSPTILVDGRDVTGAQPSQGRSCRIYADSEVNGAPSLHDIVSALQRGVPVGRQ